MRRRDFITFLGGAAAAGPLGARAQQSERVRRIGALFGLAANDLEGEARNGAFLQGLQQLGWTNGRNVLIDTRWAAGDADSIRRYAAELKSKAASGKSRPSASTASAIHAPRKATHRLSWTGSSLPLEGPARPQGGPTGAAFRAREFRHSASLYWVAKGSKPTIWHDSPPGCAARQRSRTAQTNARRNHDAEIENRVLAKRTREVFGGRTGRCIAAKKPPQENLPNCA